MIHLLKIEWLKVKNYRTFWILAGLFPLSIFSINYIVYTIQQKIYSAEIMHGMAKMLIGSPPYGFPQTWQMTSYVSSYLLFIPGLLMIILLTNEYTFKTHRQNVIDGFSRTEFIITKLILGLIIAVVSTFFTFLVAYSFGVIEGSESASFERL